MAKGNTTPARLLAGQATRLSRTMHDIRYDALHDEVSVTNPFAKAILTFRGGASGEEPPVRVIQGPSTQLEGSLDRMDVDPVHNEIFVPSNEVIFVYPREANGDTAPLRVIRGPDTQLHNVISIAVDPVHNVIVAGFSRDTQRETGLGGLLIFNRTDNGNIKPRGIIQGPHTGLLLPEQLQIYAPRGFIVLPQTTSTFRQEPEGTFIGVWSINDNGDVPPRWKLGGPKSMIKRPRGLSLNPKFREILVADMRANAVMVYSFPEIF
jgi:hypothetical protein